MKPHEQPSTIGMRVNMVVEIEQGSTDKIEYDVEEGVFKLDRVVDQPYPCYYGFIPSTRARDEDPLDAVLVTDGHVISEDTVLCKVLGIMDMYDGGTRDAKVLLAPISSHATMGSLWDDGNLDRIIKFFETYKDGVTQCKWQGFDEAVDTIVAAHNRHRLYTLQWQHVLHPRTRGITAVSAAHVTC